MLPKLFAADLMPSGAVADRRGNGAWCDLRADFGEMKVHAFGANAGRDDGGRT